MCKIEDDCKSIIFDNIVVRYINSVDSSSIERTGQKCTLDDTAEKCRKKLMKKYD